MKIAFFGSSLVSAYWNGAATYYRGIIRALHELGHQITFYEPDAYDRQKHRDIPDPDWARVVVYTVGDESGALNALEQARGVDMLIKTSGVGVYDQQLEAAVLALKDPNTISVFWDVDAPATLDRVNNNPLDPFKDLIPLYDLILTYGGGEPVVRSYKALGARECVPIYNALDPDTHHPVPREQRFECDLALLANRLPDREARIEQFFLAAAAGLPDRRFMLGGSGWADKSMPENVKYVGHVYTRDHNAFNCSARAVLNVNRDSMASYGFSPPTRIFEAAGAGACLITDAWEGIETFLTPGREVLVAHDADEVVQHLESLDHATATSIGDAALRRVLAEHTYRHRAQQLNKLIVGAFKRMTKPLDIVIFGLSITSSWGNGHATTFRALVRALSARGHNVCFLERDVPWYAEHRDLPDPPFGLTRLYKSVAELKKRFARRVMNADLCIVGSYVPDGVAIGEWVQRTCRGVKAFYDIDTPVTLAKLAAGDTEYVTASLVRRYDLYLSFAGGPVLTQIEDKHGSPMARALYCSVDPKVYFPEERALKWDLGYMGTYSADRQPGLDHLLIEPARRSPELKTIVAGPMYPRELTWPKNVERIEHLAPASHRRFYNSQRYTLNLTRADMQRAGYSPSVRIFEAAACGTPIISDYWRGLEDFFELEKEILTASTTAEMLVYLNEIPEKERRAMGERARRRVLANHTPEQRALELESYVNEVMKISMRAIA